MKDGFVRVGAACPEIRVADPMFNAAKICELAEQAAGEQVKVLVFPELCLTGSTCGDLFLQRTLLQGAEEALKLIMEASVGLDELLLVGLPVAVQGGIYSAAAVIWEGRLLGLVPRGQLSPRGETSEGRLFQAGTPERKAVSFCGAWVPFQTGMLFAHRNLPELVVGAALSEELWAPAPPSTALALSGATVIGVLAASAELIGRSERRNRTVLEASGRLAAGMILSCAGEGESTGDLVFTGQRLIAERGECLAQCQGEPGLIYTELDLERLSQDRQRLGIFRQDPEALSVAWGGDLIDTPLSRAVPKSPFVPLDPEERAARSRKILELQALGLKKRIAHTGTKRLVVGVSGGLDSTLAMLVCAKALDLLEMPRQALLAVTMPCFGTTSRTKSNAEKLAECLGAELRVVDIRKSVEQHFLDIGHDKAVTDVTYENAQARERTQVLMDLANDCSGMVVGTGDLSELALGWATYNGDHMSMYDVNGGVPKTLLKSVVGTAAADAGGELEAVLRDILDTPISPELLPPSEGQIAQKTEDLVGPYELHDFFLYYALRWGFTPGKVYRLAKAAFQGNYDEKTLYKWLENFYRRFFSQQFKRSCLPDGPKVGSVSLSPRGDWVMPSDASRALWLEEVQKLKP
ncbi:MAG: NAD(+) synthase [Oscillospiraceae bacterium]|nr:NAD(+) synthase [Oscillospiraceae bacterium]